MDISRLTSHQVIALDGFSGSGKTTVARQLAAQLPHTVVAVEDFVPGWHGLAEGVAKVEAELLAPYRRGERATLATYNWERGQAGPLFHLDPGVPILLEGCGAGAMAHELIDYLIWLDIGEAARIQQLDAREDYELYLPYRQIWHAQEVELAELHRTRERADCFGNPIHDCDDRTNP